MYVYVLEYGSNISHILYILEMKLKLSILSSNFVILCDRDRFLYQLDLKHYWMLYEVKYYMLESMKVIKNYILYTTFQESYKIYCTHMHAIQEQDTALLYIGFTSDSSLCIICKCKCKRQFYVSLGKYLPPRQVLLSNIVLTSWRDNPVCHRNTYIT